MVRTDSIAPARFPRRTLAGARKPRHAMARAELDIALNTHTRARKTYYYYCSGRALTLGTPIIISRNALSLSERLLLLWIGTHNHFAHHPIIIARYTQSFSPSSHYYCSGHTIIWLTIPLLLLGTYKHLAHRPIISRNSTQILFRAVVFFCDVTRAP